MSQQGSELNHIYALSRDLETVKWVKLRMKKLLDEKSMIQDAKEEDKIDFLKLIMSEIIVREYELRDKDD